jgi:hypothetical protein
MAVGLARVLSTVHGGNISHDIAKQRDQGQFGRSRDSSEREAEGG